VPIPPPKHREPTLVYFCDELRMYADPKYGGEMATIPVQKLDEMKRFAADREEYYRHIEERMHRLEDLVNSHLSKCPDPPFELLTQRNNYLKEAFRNGHVLCADKHSGKTTAIYETASEIADQCSCRVGIVSAHPDLHRAEAVRRRMAGTGLNQLNRLDFFGPDQVEKLRGFGSEIVVDDWFDLPITTRAVLATNFKVLAAVGKVQFGSLAQINKDGTASIKSYT
jgi:hypothetical protein